MTQQDLASVADVGRQWLNAFEAGQKGSAPLDMVLRVIAALGVSVTLAQPAPALSPYVDDEPIDLDSLLDGTQR